MFRRCLELIRRYGSSSDALLKGFSGAAQLEVAAEGCWIQGSEGEQFLDCGSFSKFLLGHQPQAIIDVLHDQLEQLSGTSRVFTNVVYAQALKALSDLCPSPLSKTMILNTGAEAVEAAIKLARVATHRPCIAHLSFSYHGKTAGALSLTDAERYKPSCHTLLKDVIRIDRTCLETAAGHLETGKVAAVFVEPIQGEGGIFELQAEQLKTLSALCRQTGTLLVADEIQSGLGRSGQMWAFQQSEILPDIVLVGKALGAGIVPVSALVATPQVFKPCDQDALLFQSTYAANPLACATLCAVTRIIQEDDIPALATQKGAWLKKSLEQLQTSFPRCIKTVRGRGLLLGVECQTPQIASFLLQACMKERLLLTPCLTQPKVLRITPSAYIDGVELDLLYSKLKAAFINIEEKLQPPPKEMYHACA